MCEGGRQVQTGVLETGRENGTRGECLSVQFIVHVDGLYSL